MVEDFLSVLSYLEPFFFGFLLLFMFRRISIILEKTEINTKKMEELENMIKNLFIKK